MRESSLLSFESEDREAPVLTPSFILFLAFPTLVPLLLNNPAGPQNRSASYAPSAHVPHVYALPPSLSSALLSSALYKGGAIVLQDLASCFPAQILADHWAARLRLDQGKKEEDEETEENKEENKEDEETRLRQLHAIDATAAPGNKTSHLSTLLYELCERPSGSSRASAAALVPTRVTAFERDPIRFRTLKALMQRCGALEEGEEVDEEEARAKGKHHKGASANAKGKANGKPAATTAAAQQTSAGAGAHNVRCLNEDFLATDPAADERWADVRLMMLDPSCSGSGILGRLDHLSTGPGGAAGGRYEEEQEQEQEADEALDPAEHESASRGGKAGNKGSGDAARAARLESLAAFQLAMIEHAMRFPALEAFTYSTCSVHVEEDEAVVARALASAIAKKRGWHLAPRERVLPSWPCRGKSLDGRGKGMLEKWQSEACIRALPGGDGEVLEGLTGTAEEPVPHVEATNGFFVCLFVRKP